MSNSFTQKYPIIARYIDSPSKRRSGNVMSTVKFIVAHDTGNPKSTAAQNVSYYRNSKNDMSASAHIFVDDKEIIECVPALTGTPEKAWHVWYNVTTDNQLFGANANDAAVGVEYCYGGSINADEAYKRYVWVIAFICWKFKLDPAKSVTGHCFLDPKRKTDPVSGLGQSRRTYDQLLRDVVAEYNECIGNAPPPPVVVETPAIQLKATTKLNIRKAKPSVRADIASVAVSGTLLVATGTVKGDLVNNNDVWYTDGKGNFFWSGGVVTV
ncbi:MAG: peptidoglycan recognition protein family protein [Bacteroidia bacterium]